MSEPKPTCAKAQSKRPLSAEQRTVNDAQQFFKRFAGGKVKKASDEQVEQCKAGLEMFKGLTKSEKLEFAKKVEETKNSKSFGWVRDFRQSLAVSRSEVQQSTENYYTRTFEFHAKVCRSLRS